MPALLPLIFTLAIICVLVWGAVQLIALFPGFFSPPIRVLFIMAVALICIFVLASLFNIPLLEGLRLK